MRLGEVEVRADLVALVARLGIGERLLGLGAMLGRHLLGEHAAGVALRVLGVHLLEGFGALRRAFGIAAHRPVVGEVLRRSGREPGHGALAVGVQLLLLVEVALDRLGDVLGVGVVDEVAGDRRGVVAGRQAHRHDTVDLPGLVDLQPLEACEHLDPLAASASRMLRLRVDPGLLQLALAQQPLAGERASERPTVRGGLPGGDRLPQQSDSTSTWSGRGRRRWSRPPAP